MKSIIYKNPVTFGIILNISAMFVAIYAIKYSISPLFMAIITVGIINRKILDNGVCMNKKKKTIILFSFAVMISVIFLYNIYFHNMISEQLEKM